MDPIWPDLDDRLTRALGDRYRVERELGSGGMATVHLAEDLRHHRRVAIKVLHPELSAVLGPERFLKEIELTANLQHPHILPLFDSGAADGLLYYVMPYVDGETLRGRLTRERQLPVADAVRIAREVADALAYAHKRGVVHRDIKPENILLHDGRPMVADFGIALAVQQAGGERMTQTGMSLGTPQYMAPEQAMGERGVDHRADIYALGAVTYEMLAGEPPFTGPTAQAVVAKVITENPRPLGVHRPAVPAHVEDAIDTALQKLPADRFGDAAAFADALDEARPRAPTGRVGRPTHASARGERRLERWLAIAGWSVAALAAVLATWALLRGRPSDPVSRFAVLLESNYISSGSDTPAISPDGSLFVYTSEDGGLLMRARDQLRATPIGGAENGWSPFFSPDGRTIAFFGGFPGSLRTVPVSGGAPVTLLPDSAYGYGGAWSRDGWIYYIGSEPLALMRIRASGGTPELLLRPDTTRDELFFGWPTLLPGDRHVLLAVQRRRGAADIAVVDVESRRLTTLTNGVRAFYTPTGHLVVVDREGAVSAVRFDVRRLEMRGRPVVLDERVRIGTNGYPPVALSSTGTLLYDGSFPAYQIVRVRRDGVSTVVDPSWTGQFFHVALSRDGTRLAVVVRREGRSELWVKSLTSGSLTRLSSEGTYSYRPTWTPDDQSVLFTSDRSGRPSLYRVAADGGSEAELELAHPQAVDEGELSRDGRWLVLRLGSGGRRDIYARAADDTTLRPILTSPYQEYSPTLSPDGRWLAYASDEATGSEVFVRPFPGARTRFQVSSGGGTEPVWSASGRELFYRNVRGGLVAVQVTTEPTFRILGERVLFTPDRAYSDTRNRSYAVSADGQYFYFTRAVPGPSGHLVVVQNWFRELNDKVGR